MKPNHKNHCVALLRAARGSGLRGEITQEALAEQLGWSRWRVVKYEGNRTYMPLTFEAVTPLAEMVQDRLSRLDDDAWQLHVRALLEAIEPVLGEDTLAHIIGVECPIVMGENRAIHRSASTEKLIARAWLLAALDATAGVRSVA